MNATEGFGSEERPAVDGWALVRPRVSLPIAVAVAIGAAVTVLLTVTDVLHVSYRSTPLHVAVETASACASIVAAQSILGRFRSSLQLRDLMLTASLSLFAASNLFFAVVPDVIHDHPGAFRTWARIAANLVAAALLAGAPYTADRTVRHPRVAVRRTLLYCAGGAALIAVAVAAASGVLPRAVPIAAAPGHGPHIVGNPVVLGSQLVLTALFAAAAVGFGRRADRTDDVLLRWIAVAAVLGGFARLNYFLFPSLYTEWFYTGDGLRLASFLALFAGGVQETRRLQRDLAASAVLEERRRIARELHDGVTQDLAYIVQQLRHGIAPGAPEGLVTAAERALDESRHAIAALVRPATAPLGRAVAETAREVAGREGGVAVETDVPRDFVVPGAVQQELLRIVRESVINAIRHGGATRIHVQVREEPRISVSVIDDGAGFDPRRPRGAGRMGMRAMADRAAAIGADLAVESVPGTGTVVRVTLP